MFTNKIAAITGGTGSFGRRILRYFLTTDIREVRVFSRDEKKQEEVRHDFMDPRVRSYIGDVRNFDSVHLALKNVDFVFHAAALKQVPSCEFYPLEAIKTNVLGADHVIDYTKEDFTKSAERYDVMLDNVGNHSLSECKGVLTPAGKYVLIGGGGAGDQGFLGGRGKALWAMVFSKFVNQQMGMMMADANQKDLTILADMMESGKLKPVIDRTYKSLAEIPDAIRYLETGHAQGKVVISVAVAATAEN